MANTVAVLKATPFRLTLLVTGDGTVATLIANATLLAAMAAGPLKDLWNATYADQAAMRTALTEGGDAGIWIRKRTVVAAVTAEVSDCSADVDVDATTPTKAEINLQWPDQTGMIGIVDIWLRHKITA